MFLLDTNVVSEQRRRNRAAPQVLAWANTVDASRLFASAITKSEVEKGASLLKRRAPPLGSVFDQWTRNHVLPSLAGQILPFDEAVALRCASLHVPNTRPERDSMFAATALEHRLTAAARTIADSGPWSSRS